MNRTTNILLIEDDKSICSFITTALSGNGYHITSAYTGKEGLNLASADLPDIILLDLGLPDIDGCQVLKCYPAFYLVLNHPTFNQIKKKHGINYSDKFYIRLLYAVSFVLSYSLPHKKIAGLTLEKSGLLLLTHR